MKLLTVLIVYAASGIGAFAKSAPQQQVVKIVAQIQRADYEDNRAALKQLCADLAEFTDDKAIASRVLYWRGFALCRRAFNGFNDSVDPGELGQDLQQALDEFNQAAVLDPGFLDAKVGAISCLSNLMYLSQKDSKRIGDLLAESGPLVKEAKAAQPDNPRLLWVLGPIYWYNPPDRGGGQAKAIESYERGLASIRSQKPVSNNVLDPTWGEPELLMNLAWANLNKAVPDVIVAEQNAQAALKLVPYWHYLRDILVPQIQSAKTKNN